MSLKNVFYYIVGIFFLTLAKVKSVLKGYSSPKPFSVSETEKCIDYDIRIADQWLVHLQEFTNNNNFIADKTVLELGPGSDLGSGLYLLSRGCAEYNGFDANDLMKNTPDSFYEQFLRRINKMNTQTNIKVLKNQLHARKEEPDSKLNYVVNKDFDLVSSFGETTIDLVFSQAAFEHFDDIDNTICQLSKICKSGAILVAEIDLQCHSRWIREKDPNNIYRYSNNIYNAFWFRGIPNRVRPFQYEEAFKRNGWSDISIKPLKSLSETSKSFSGMHKNFSDDKDQMDILSIVLCARKQ